MRVTVLTTHTMNTAPIFESLRPLVTNLDVIIYDMMTHADHEQLPELVRSTEPDWVLVIGAIEEFHCKPVPFAEIYRQINKVAPAVHLCCDAADRPWWPYLEEYHKQGCFTYQMSIDGVREGPIAEFGHVTITPIDESTFPEPKPWDERDILLGFAGGIGHGLRGELINTLVGYGYCTHMGNGYKPEDEYRAFLQRCKCTLNHPMTGSGHSMHVKGRVIEAALSGTLLFELDGSPTEDFFDPNVDYIAYKHINDIVEGIGWVIHNPIEAQAMAERLRQKVLEKYCVREFWKPIIEKLGVKYD